MGKVRTRIGNRLEDRARELHKAGEIEDSDGVSSLADPIRRGDLKRVMAEWNRLDRWQRDMSMAEIVAAIFEAG